MFEQEIATAIGFVAGYTAGQSVETWAAHHGDQVVNTTLSRSHESAIRTQEEADEISRRSRIQRVVANRGFKALVIAAGMTGAYTALAWTPESTHETSRPFLEVVVDHGNEVVTDNKTGAINKLGESIGEDGRFQTEVTIAQAGQLIPVKANQISAFQPWGSADLQSGVQQGISRDYSNLQKSNSSNSHEAAVVVITDDEDISPASVDAMEQASKVPVYIDNVNGSKDTPSKDLNSIATSTQGQYWAQSGNAKSIEDSIDKALKKKVSVDTMNAPQSDKDILKVLSVISVGLMFVWGWRRTHPVYDRGERVKAKEGDK